VAEANRIMKLIFFLITVWHIGV